MLPKKILLRSVTEKMIPTSNFYIMKTKILIIAFTVAVIASFSFITINKDSLSKKENTPVIQNNEPMSGFALEDENQF